MSAAYDNYDYPTYWSDRNYEHESEVIAIRAFLNKITKISRIVDIGGGFGRLTPYYVFRSKISVVSDPSQRLLDEGEKRLLPLLKNLKFRKTKLKFLKSNVVDLKKKLLKNNFDLALMVRVMHHIDDPEEALDTIDHLLKPGGYLILEFANKIHGKALISNVLKGDITFPIDIFPSSRLSEENSKNSLPFLNYHPDIIKDKLKKHNFKIIEVRSVSNIRSTFIKKYLPVPIMLGIEKYFQKALSTIYFGPSIFILARKRAS